jgi:hypothetical protein
MSTDCFVTPHKKSITLTIRSRQILRKVPHLLMAFALVFFIQGCVRQPENQPLANENPQPVADPLPSWNDGAVKHSITAFVTQATDSSSKGFIPITERIATFDNDGTLWAERPIVQELFATARLKSMLEKDKSLAQKQPFKAAATGDKSYFEKGGAKAAIELLLATHTGMTEEEFHQDVVDFFANTKYPNRNTSLRGIRYQPQLELLEYLRANGFKVYICTGGTVEFVRAISKDYYGIPEEQVIGSSFKYAFLDSSRKIMRKPELDRFNDQAEKPASIQLHIGKPPVLACGNEGGHGDIAMLKFSQTSRFPTLQLLVNHDDGEREYAYSEKDSASVSTARANKWQVISIKNDWKKVFAN